MAHINKRGDTWRAEVCVNRKRKSRSFDNLDAAEAWAALQEGKVGTVAAAHGKAISSLHLSQVEIVANALPFVRVGGIYFLVKGAGIVYIGKSTHLLRRIAQHNNNGIEFDGYYFILCEDARATVLEEYYIKKFNPHLNIVFRGGMKSAKDLEPEWIEMDDEALLDLSEAK